MRRLLPLAVLLVLLTTACRIESNVSAQINADGSGVMGIEVGYDEEAATFIEGFGGGEELFAENPLADLPNVQTSEEDRGGMHYRIWSVEVEDIAAVIEQQLVSGSDGFIQEFHLSIEPNRVEVTGRGNAGAAMEGLGDTGGFLSPEDLAESISVNLRLTLPGKILEHNADAKDGNTLTWAIPITGAALDVRAVSDPTQSEGGGFPMWVIIVIAAVVIVGIAAIALRGRKRGQAVPPPPPPPPAPDLPPA